LNHTAVQINAGGQRAWRAPNHPQAAYLTCCAIDDLAAALKMDPLEVFKKNADVTAFPEVYRYQLDKAADLVGWKKLWHPRGASGKGAIKRGLGIGVGTWGGAGHPSQCRTTIHPDGAVEVELASQDLGTGTRTVIAMVAAETLGLPVGAIRLNIGDNRYPPSGSSGGSTTVGGVSSSTRKSTMNALTKLFEVVAPGLGGPAEELEAVAGKIQVKGNPAKSILWKAACKKLGVNPISEMGANNPKEAPKEGGVRGEVTAASAVDEPAKRPGRRPREGRAPGGEASLRPSGPRGPSAERGCARRKRHWRQDACGVWIPPICTFRGCSALAVGSPGLGHYGLSIPAVAPTIFSINGLGPRPRGWLRSERRLPVRRRAGTRPPEGAGK
jgi:hypothetical protein